MIRALLLGLRGLTDPAVQRLLLRCVLLALATFVLLVGAVAGVLFGFDLTGVSWLDPVLATAGSVAALVLAWLLFPVTIGLILGLFAEDVVAAVERRYYPELPAAPGMSLSAQVSTGARFLAVALPLNLIALPLYLVPGANVPVYLALNGYLLGREYFTLVAGQRLPLGEMDQLRRRLRGTAVAGGRPDRPDADNSGVQSDRSGGRDRVHGPPGDARRPARRRAAPADAVRRLENAPEIRPQSDGNI